MSEVNIYKSQTYANTPNGATLVQRLKPIKNDPIKNKIHVSMKSHRDSRLTIHNIMTNENKLRVPKSLRHSL